jgi:hypothetical protein
MQLEVVLRIELKVALKKYYYLQSMNLDKNLTTTMGNKKMNAKTKYFKKSTSYEMIVMIVML